MTDAELREWAEYHEEFSKALSLFPPAVSILRLLDENAALREQVVGHVERIAAQSELLSRRAELPHDPRTELPPSIDASSYSGIWGEKT